jgi:hypothetical protein
VQNKKKKHEEMMAKVGDRHKFETSASKWRKILALIMNAHCSTHVENGPTCKDKWSTITSGFKKIFDFMVGIGQNQKY